MMRRYGHLYLSLVAATGAALTPFLAQAADTAPSFEVYGFAMGDYIQDFKRVNPAWEDTLRPSKIPTTAGQYGSDGQASVSAKQSRLGVQGNLPVEGKDLYTKFEFDWWGVGADEGKVTPRLRHAYGQWGQWLAGQTHSLFMDIDAFPNVIDYWGPAGLVFLRNPQIRWTPMEGEYTVAVAIERPTNDIDPGTLRTADPSLATTGQGGNLQTDEKLPDLTAQVRRKGNWGHVQLAGILRRLGYDTVGNFDSIPKGHSTGWGFDLTSTLKVVDFDKVILSAVYGRGIASYMNDGGTDQAAEGTLTAPQATSVPLFGLTAYYEHAWSEHFNSVFGYSRTQVINRSLQDGGAFHSGEYASANVLYLPSKSILIGAEALWGRRKDRSGNQGDDIRSQISFKYSFSSKDFFGKS